MNLDLKRTNDRKRDPDFTDYLPIVGKLKNNGQPAFMSSDRYKTLEDMKQTATSQEEFDKITKKQRDMAMQEVVGRSVFNTALALADPGDFGVASLIDQSILTNNRTGETAAQTIETLNGSHNGPADVKEDVPGNRFDVEKANRDAMWIVTAVRAIVAMTGGVYAMAPMALMGIVKQITGYTDMGNNDLTFKNSKAVDSVDPFSILQNAIVQGFRRSYAAGNSDYKLDYTPPPKIQGNRAVEDHKTEFVNNLMKDDTVARQTMMHLLDDGSNAGKKYFQGEWYAPEEIRAMIINSKDYRLNSDQYAKYNYSDIFYVPDPLSTQIYSSWTTLTQEQANRLFSKKASNFLETPRIAKALDSLKDRDASAGKQADGTYRFENETWTDTELKALGELAKGVPDYKNPYYAQLTNDQWKRFKDKGYKWQATATKDATAQQITENLQWRQRREWSEVLNDFKRQGLAVPTIDDLGGTLGANATDADLSAWYDQFKKKYSALQESAVNRASTQSTYRADMQRQQQQQNLPYKTATPEQVFKEKKIFS